jgi:hypothetical protein
MSRGDTGATIRRPGRQSWGEWQGAVEGETGGIAVPALAVFAGAKRTQLAVLAKSTAAESLHEVMGNVTRVASMRPQTFGRAQTLARLRALSRPAVAWEDAGRSKGESRLVRVSVQGVPDTRRTEP